MTPFHRAELPPHSFDVAWVAHTFKCSVDAAQRQVEEARKEKVFMNSRYQVNVREVNPGNDWPCPMLWLSIKRLDKEPIHDWRDLQEIKNKIVGPEFEGVEIYPAESRLVDIANQYHLWVFMSPKVRLPFGFTERSVSGAEEAASFGGKQRPFQSEEA